MVFPSWLREVPHAISRQETDTILEPVVALSCTGTYLRSKPLQLIQICALQLKQQDGSWLLTPFYFSDFSIYSIAVVNTKEVEQST